MNRLFLFWGIILSVSSKLLQIKYGSIWGDFLVLPAASFFVLAILSYNKSFMTRFERPESKRIAIQFGASIALFVLLFQLFTMLAFGKENILGYLVLIPLCIVGAFTWRLFYKLK